MIPTVTGMKLRFPPPLIDTRLYRASTNVSKLVLNGSFTPPPMLNPKSFSDAVLKNFTVESMGFNKADYTKIVAIK